MKIYYSPYQLLKKTKLNSSDRPGEQQGALIRLAEGSDWGVADLSPKIELGDADYTEQMAKRGPLFLRAIELARADLNARKDSRSLLDTTEVENNFLITDYRNTDMNASRFAGKTLKIKGDRNLLALTDSLNTVNDGVTLRVDFNNCLSDVDFSQWLLSMPAELKRKIQYIEDPTPLSENWKIWSRQIALAYDFQKAKYSEKFCRYRIFKPTREAVSSNCDRTVLTSAMEHPVGLAHGLRLAQELKPKTVSGFLTLDLFQETDFHSYYRQQDNYLSFAPAALNDSGIGMTAELDRLDWRFYE